MLYLKLMPPIVYLGPGVQDLQGEVSWLGAFACKIALLSRIISCV